MYKSPYQKNKNNGNIPINQNNEVKKQPKKYSVALLKKMPEFQKYQQDAITALLTKKEYTKADALKILQDYFHF